MTEPTPPRAATPTRDTYGRIALNAQLELEEKRLHRVYYDTARPPNPTIGVGRNLNSPGIRPAETHAIGVTRASCFADGLTDPQIDFLRDADVDLTVADLDAQLPWWRGLDPVRQRVLLDMGFNMGVGRAPSLLAKGKGLLGFAATLAKVRAHDFAGAAANMAASAWDGQVGTRADRLERQMRTGVA